MTTNLHTYPTGSVDPSTFAARNRVLRNTYWLLALAFLVMVGMALTAEAFDQHVPKGYIYAAMAFSLAVEALNIRSRAKRAAKAAQASSVL